MLDWTSSNGQVFNVGRPKLEDLEAMKTFFGLPCFTRRWVIQEYRLVKPNRRWFLIGGETVSAQSLITAVIMKTILSKHHFHLGPLLTSFEGEI